MSFNNDFGLKANRRKKYDLFISHSWDYDDDYERLTDRLEDKNRFKFRNYSVPEKDKVKGKSNKALRRHLREKQIKPASVVLVLAGMYSSHSYWIPKEIEIAENLEKPIIGVEPWGQSRVPTEVRDAANKMVGWNKDTIVRAIRNLSP